MRTLIIALVLAVLFGIHFYLIYSLWKFLPANAAARAALIVFACLVPLAPFVNYFFGEHLPLFLTSSLHHIAFSWVIFAVYFLIAFFLLDICRWFHVFPVARVLYANWWSVLGIGAFALLIILVGHIRYSNKVRVAIELELAKDTGSPLVIVGISDLHLGDGIGKEEFEDWIGRINAEDPDLVLIAGDIVDNNISAILRRGIAESFAKIASRYGVYAVPGNHEYIAGIQESEAFIRSTGITLLRDQAALIDERLYLVGRDDRSNAGRKSLQELVEPLDTAKAVIVLDHQPFELDAAERSGADLQFSGHTHHGQIWPISWITEWMYEIAHGYLRKGGSHIYVSSGIGIWGGKFRIGTQSEYVVFRISGGGL